MNFLRDGHYYYYYYCRYQYLYLDKTFWIFISKIYHFSNRNDQYVFRLSFLKTAVAFIAWRGQILKKTYFQNSEKFGYSFIKSDIGYIYLFFIYKNLIMLSLLETVTLNFTMYILTISTGSLKIMSLENRFFKSQPSLNQFQ